MCRVILPFESNTHHLLITLLGAPCVTIVAPKTPASTAPGRTTTACVVPATVSALAPSAVGPTQRGN